MNRRLEINAGSIKSLSTQSSQSPAFHFFLSLLQLSLETPCAEAVLAREGFRAVIDEGGAQGLRWLVFIVVNAEGHAGFDADRSDHVPSIFRVTQAVADIPLGRYSNDSLELLREALARWANETTGPDGRRMQAYYIEVSLEGVDAEADRQRLRLLPTALSLPADDVHRIMEAGKTLFRRSPELARLLQDLRKSP